jgi:hypothetical protein
MAWFLKSKSVLDGKPLYLAISAQSDNSKTGGMLQSWIIRSDVHPVQAVRSGKDRSVCGACPQRWSVGGACYVIVAHGPGAIYKSIKAGKLGTSKALDLDNPPKALLGKTMRLGSYGDPAALPFNTWIQVLDRLKIKGWTGYTHQWRTCDPKFKDLLMASCDSVEDLTEARAKGWRTFRVRKPGDPILAGEFACPASEEEGKRLTCETCLACDGGRAQKVSPVIVAHGVKARSWINARL